MTEALMNRMRWKIEEMHKHVKQAYQWEMIQLSSYTRLQNMNQILLLTMCFLYSLKSFAASYLQAFPNIMAYTNQDWKKILGFIYYKLTMLEIERDVELAKAQSLGVSETLLQSIRDHYADESVRVTTEGNGKVST
ncbi:MAG: hypothetical protein WC923_07835 [Bacteroidales bacterium]|jgi:hypothetical protein|nr:hypothetical protein [Candidatus Cloacimonadota bacterium]MDD3548197.1 hypothetical protein [Candidatus Cloacimonadota bacterium]